jgi:hypothetical protein
MLPSRKAQLPALKHSTSTPYFGTCSNYQYSEGPRVVIDIYFGFIFSLGFSSYRQSVGPAYNQWRRALHIQLIQAFNGIRLP